MTCLKCGAPRIRTKTLPRYQDDGLVGLPNVVVLNAARQHTCEACGTDNGISVPDVEGLEAAVAVTRVMIPVRLSGREIRFLRTALGFKATELADKLEIGGAGEKISRWENEKAPISSRDEKMLRILAGHQLSDRAKAIEFDETKIFAMKIPAVVKVPRKEVEMQFLRIRISDDTWAEPAKAA
jgi:DNA-binding transcriptional regulator YiaG